MYIRLLATQIGDFWELIKYALNRVEKLEGRDYNKVYNSLLAELLSDKAQCIICYSYDDKIVGIIITNILNNSLDNTKNLHIRCLYAFISTEIDYWNLGLDYIKSMARDEGCSKIVFESSNPKLIALTKSLGAIEVSTNLCIEV